MDTSNLLGWIGAILLLLSYVLNAVNYWTTNNFLYKLCNFLGSVLLLASALMIDALPFVVINTLWAGVSLVSLFRTRSKA